MIAGLGLFLGSAGILWALTLQIPDFNSYFDQRIIAESTKLYDRTGKILLYNAHSDIRRTIVPLDQMSDHVKKATIAIEDVDFYNHRGIKPTAILRAFWVNVSSGRVEQGGSTLTQQVIKNTLLTKDKSIARKVKEAILSIKLESELPKDEILELYLNEVPYGGNLYGIEEASKAYFGKESKNLSLAEAAYLASLPQAPSYLSPYGSHQDKLEERKNLVLSRLKSLDWITDEEYQQAKAEEVLFAKPDKNSIKAPHFVFFVLEYLEDKYGQDTVKNGGFRVITSLDWELQQKAEEIVYQYGTQNAANYQARNAGLVALDPQTGQILAMVGSIDYFDLENEGNFNVTTARRQPGSAFKPFVYATAFNEGYTADTIVFDLKTEFNASCSPEHIPLSSGITCYSPTNYDGSTVGPISLKNALAQSRNIPAVKVLYLAGLKDSFDTARKLGISTLRDYRQYGLTLVLGGGEVTLLDMTSAYGVFANDGARQPYSFIMEINDRNKKTLEKYNSQSTQVLPPNTARLISNILSDNSARAPIFGTNSQLNIPGYQVAVKTGTTNDYKDAWIVGYTPSLVVGAWVGNNDNTPMDKRIAGVIVAPIWNTFMKDYLKNKSVQYFIPPEPAPSDVKPILRGIWSGLAGGELADEGVHSILHWVNKNNPQGPVPINPASDPQYYNWEAPVQAWAAATGNNFLLTPGILPSGLNEPTKEEFGSDRVEIRSLRNSYKPDDNITVSLDETRAVIKAEFFLNDRLLGTVTRTPFRFSFVPEESADLSSINTIIVIVYDSKGNKQQLEETFRLND